MNKKYSRFKNYYQDCDFKSAELSDRMESFNLNLHKAELFAKLLTGVGIFFIVIILFWYIYLFCVLIFPNKFM
jgi:hypothetical protein